MLLSTQRETECSSTSRASLTQRARGNVDRRDVLRQLISGDALLLAVRHLGGQEQGLSFYRCSHYARADRSQLRVRGFDDNFYNATRSPVLDLRKLYD